MFEFVLWQTCMGTENDIPKPQPKTSSPPIDDKGYGAPRRTDVQYLLENTSWSILRLRSIST